MVLGVAAAFPGAEAHCHFCRTSATLECMDANVYSWGHGLRVAQEAYDSYFTHCLKQIPDKRLAKGERVLFWLTG